MDISAPGDPLRVRAWPTVSAATSSLELRLEVYNRLTVEVKNAGIRCALFPTLSWLACLLLAQSTRVVTGFTRQVASYIGSFAYRLPVASDSQALLYIL